MQEKDELYDDAKNIVIETQRASVSQLQRRFRIGYNRAAMLMSALEKDGIIGPFECTKTRKVLVL
ncbi:MAG: DNA translocase FtsK [bacterium]